VTQAIESEGIMGEKEKIGHRRGRRRASSARFWAAVKGAVAGVLIGGGGTIARPRGMTSSLPAGSVLRSAGLAARAAEVGRPSRFRGSASHSGERRSPRLKASRYVDAARLRLALRDTSFIDLALRP
jgi:hypothetical protein